MKPPFATLAAPPPAQERFRGAAPRNPALVREVLAGLNQVPATVPSKWFYDARGSALFDRITRLPEYYLTRTELGIMRRHARAMAGAIGERAVLVELGSGSSTKTRLLLDALRDPAGYVPVDISEEYLLDAARSIRRDYPRLEVLPLVGDYSKPLDLPQTSMLPSRHAVYFPGSTLGNLDPGEAEAFLTRVGRWCSGDAAAEPCGLLIGVDMVKPADLLIPAYDDAQGVTAEFNYNLLDRINREASGDFNRDRWAHRAAWDDGHRRMESHLESLCDQNVHIADHTIRFDRGTTIRTECSYKHTLESLCAAASAWTLRQVWSDDREWFTVAWFEAKH